MYIPSSLAERFQGDVGAVCDDGPIGGDCVETLGCPRVGVTVVCAAGVARREVGVVDLGSIGIRSTVSV